LGSALPRPCSRGQLDLQSDPSFLGMAMLLDSMIVGWLPSRTQQQWAFGFTTDQSSLGLALPPDPMMVGPTLH